MEPLINALKTAHELARRAVSEWIIFLSVFAVCIALGIGISLAVGQRFTSSMTITAISGDQSMLAGLSGAANLLSSGSVSSLASSVLNPTSALDNYQSLLQSSLVANALARNHGMDHRMFAGVDPKTGLWKNTLRRRAKVIMYGLFGIALPDKPTTEDLTARLNQLIVITQSSQDQNTISISCTSHDRLLCKDLLVADHQEVEKRLNSLELDQAKRTAQYVTETIPKIQIAEVREALIAVLAAAEKRIAVTALNQPVAGMMLDPPNVPTLPSFPRPSLIISMSFLFGVIAASFATWIVGGRRKHPDGRPGGITGAP